jgi:hypothetical protein
MYVVKNLRTRRTLVAMIVGSPPPFVVDKEWQDGNVGWNSLTAMMKKFEPPSASWKAPEPLSDPMGLIKVVFEL